MYNKVWFYSGFLLSAEKPMRAAAPIWSRDIPGFRQVALVWHPVRLVVEPLRSIQVCSIQVQHCWGALEQATPTQHDLWESDPSNSFKTLKDTRTWTCIEHLRGWKLVDLKDKCACAPIEIDQECSKSTELEWIFRLVSSVSTPSSPLKTIQMDPWRLSTAHSWINTPLFVGHSSQGHAYGRAFRGHIQRWVLGHWRALRQIGALFIRYWIGIISIMNVILISYITLAVSWQGEGWWMRGWRKLITDK